MKHFIIYCVIVIGVSFLSLLSNMTHTENFYIHLNSDVHRTSPLQYSNSIGNFVTRLNRRYVLDGNFEVALSRIHYTKSWYNIEEDQELTLHEAITTNVHVLPESFPKGNYQSIEEIISTLNKLYLEYFRQLRSNNEDYRQAPLFEYNSYSNTVRIRLGIVTGPDEQYLYPNLDKYLANFLGLTDLNGSQYPFPNNTGIYYPFRKITPKLINKRDYDEIYESRLPAQFVRQTEQPIALPSVQQSLFNITEESVPETRVRVGPVITSVSTGESQPTIIENLNVPSEQKEIKQEPQSLSSVAPAPEKKPDIISPIVTSSLPVNSHIATISSSSTNTVNEVKTVNTPEQVIKSVPSSVITKSPITPNLSEPENPVLTESRRINVTGDMPPVTSSSSVAMTDTIPIQSKDRGENKPKVVTSGYPNKRKDEPKTRTIKKVRISNKTRDNPLHSDEPYHEPPQKWDTLEWNAYINGFKQVSLNGYINNLNVYCDLLKPVAVGDVDAPLLRTIAVSSKTKFGEYIEYEPQEREYIPLLYTEFDHIEVDIKDDYDRTIDFRFGKVYLSLHFRKVNTYGF